MATASQVLVGIVGTILLGLLVRPLVGRVKQLAPATPPNEALTEKWNALTKDPRVPKRGEWLGHLERLLFFGAAWLESYEIIKRRKGDAEKRGRIYFGGDKGLRPSIGKKRGQARLTAAMPSSK
jgi:hypothetical protein